MAKAIRVLSLFFILLILTPCIIPTGAAEPPNMDNVKSVIVINRETDTIIIEKDADKSVFPAGTAKLMTALVAYRHFEGNLLQKITVTEEMRNQYVRPWFDFLLGEEVPVESLLAAMIVGNYNDAAIILAYAVSGSVEAFAEEMTAYAASLGAIHTVYKNPTGTHHEEMVTTARDTAIIASHFMENNVLYALSMKIQHTIPPTNLSKEWNIYSKNALISTLQTQDYHYKYACGMSVGYTAEGGDCVVTGSNGAYNGLSYVCVVMGGKTTENDTNYAYTIARDALRYALANFEIMELRRDNEAVAMLPVNYSATINEIEVLTATELRALVLDDTDLKKDIRFVTELMYEQLDAPFEKGTRVGTLKAFSKDGKLLAETDLITAEGADAHPFLLFMKGITNMLSSPLFYITVIILAAGSIAAYLCLTKKGRKKVRKRTRFE